MNTFEIKKMEDVIKMKKKLIGLGSNEDVIFTASELAENMIESDSFGELTVDNKTGFIVNRIIGNIDKKKELNMFLSVSKFVYENRDIIRPAKNKTGNDSRGFLSILYSGWDVFLKTDSSEKEYTLIAFKK